MVRFIISAVLAAAAIAGAFTILTTAIDRLDAGPLAPPVEAVLKTCTQQPWPYLNCSRHAARQPECAADHDRASRRLSEAGSKLQAVPRFRLPGLEPARGSGRRLARCWKCSAAKTAPSAENISTASRPLERRSVSSACAGVCAMGPATLNEVLTADLDADAAAERLEIGERKRIGSLAHRSAAAGAVGVHDGRDQRARARPGMRREHHVVVGMLIGVARALRQFEEFLGGCSVIIGASGRMASRYFHLGV